MTFLPSSLFPPTKRQGSGSGQGAHAHTATRARDPSAQVSSASAHTAVPTPPRRRPPRQQTAVSAPPVRRRRDVSTTGSRRPASHWFNSRVRRFGLPFAVCAACRNLFCNPLDQQQDVGEPLSRSDRVLGPTRDLSVDEDIISPNFSTPLAGLLVAIATTNGGSCGDGERRRMLMLTLATSRCRLSWCHSETLVHVGNDAL